MYAGLIENKFSFIPDFNDDVIKAVDKLGIARLEELNFHKGHIKEQLVKMLDISTEQKVLKAITLNKFDFYKTSDLKAKFQSIYDNLGIKKTAKGSDVKNYYNVKETSKRIDGDVFKGYQILSEKVIIKK
jgi:putative ribosome biogenesis GTPase RsgA